MQALEDTNSGHGGLPEQQHPDVVEPAIEAESSARVLSRQELTLFHQDLRLKNPVFLWTVLVFNPVYVGWTVFDYLLVPDRWLYFLELRLGVAAITSAIAMAVSRPQFKRYSWEAIWFLVIVYCAGIAPMLPHASGANLSRYVMGYIFVIITAGLIPFWPPQWPASAILIAVGLTALVFSRDWDELKNPVGDVVSAFFVVITASTLSVVAAVFKYNLTRRDYCARLQIADVARRESEARKTLSETSRELQGALDKLEDLDRLKSKFFANISHELRTPLTLILAPVDQLEDVVRSDEGRRQLRVIRRNAERLLGLINDLLDLSRLDAGGLRLNIAEVDVRSVASAVFENSTSAAMNKGIDFKMQAEPMTEQIWGDAHRLEIVLTNLVSNAVKFTPPGGEIEMSVWDGAAGVNVDVRDNGPGISEEDLPRVFDRFFQAAPGDRRREGGVGIGLALARELVELHGGSITADSTPGVSTTFRVFLPFGTEHIRPDVVERRQQFDVAPGLGRRTEDQRRTATIEEPESRHPSGDEEPAGVTRGNAGQRSRVLLVEDHADVCDFIRTLLEPEFDLSVASNGLEAWKRISADPPDLVVSDVMMPEMDGTELCRAIKGSDRLKNIPVILLTARVGSEATLEAYAHGADDFVAKPFHPRVLMARIRAQLKLRALAIQLAQQEKMAVVGTLAAGILHEVRNPVNAIRNASRLLLAGKVEHGVTTQLLNVISDGAERIEGIAAALDSHARPADAGGSAPSDVREGIDATFRLLAHRMTEIQLHRDYQTERLANVPLGPLNQVFLNIADNAVRIGAKNIWVRVSERGDNVRVEFADDGPGVPSEYGSRIYDPFFTARSDGSGTGLGLHISRQIVETHGGSLWHEPRPGGGAVFVLEIPALAGHGYGIA
jgi:signal transduction histidine kinase